MVIRLSRLYKVGVRHFGFQDWITKKWNSVYNKVCEKEKVKFGDGCMEAILRVSDGDLRKALNLVQSLSIMER